VLTPFELSRPFDKGAGMKLRRLKFLGSAIISTVLLNGSASPLARPQSSQVSAVAVSLRDGSHDFDFLKPVRSGVLVCVFGIAVTSQNNSLGWVAADG